MASSLQTLEAELEPAEALSHYLIQKIELSRSQPKASRLFALEIIQGHRIFCLY